jgi:hypothetical protein
LDSDHLQVAHYFDVSDLDAAGRSKNFVSHIAGVQHAYWLEAEDFSFFIGARSMFRPGRYEQAFARIQDDNAVSKFDAKSPLPHHEEFVFVLMMVPGKLTQHFNDLDFLTVQAGDHLWPPMFTERAEFFGQTDLGCHAVLQDESFPECTGRKDAGPDDELQCVTWLRDEATTSRKAILTLVFYAC